MRVGILKPMLLYIIHRPPRNIKKRREENITEKGKGQVEQGKNIEKNRGEELGAALEIVTNHIDLLDQYLTLRKRKEAESSGGSPP